MLTMSLVETQNVVQQYFQINKITHYTLRLLCIDQYFDQINSVAALEGGPQPGGVVHPPNP